MTETRKVKQNRSALLYFILSIITFTIYDWFFFSSFAKDVNQICKKDGIHTRGVISVFIFSILTFGIYKYVWLIGMIDRMGENSRSYGIDIRRSGVGLFLLMFFLPGLGYVIAVCLIISDMNRLADAYMKACKNAESEHYPEVEREVIKESNEIEPINESADEIIQEEIPKQKKSEQQENVAVICGKLIGITGEHSGTEIPFIQNQKITLGRDASMVSLIVNGKRISRLHCSIQCDGGAQNSYIVTDYSTNGVFVDGKRIPRNLPVCVSAGSVLSLADGANKFQLT